MGNFLVTLTLVIMYDCRALMQIRLQSLNSIVGLNQLTSFSKFMTKNSWMKVT